ATPRLAEFVTVILADHALLIALAFAVGIRPWRRGNGPRPAVPQEAPIPSRERARAAAFLVLMALGPFLLTAFGGVFGLVRAKWFVPMFNLSGLLVVFAWGHEPDAARLRKLVAGALAVAVSTAALGGLEAVASRGLGFPPTRIDWPQAAIADVLFDTWDAATDHKPLKVVSGDKWIAGLVGISATDDPSILTDLWLDASPWITPERVARDGMLVMCHLPTSPIASACKAVMARFPGGQRSFRYSDNPAAKPIVIDYAIVPPGTPVADVRAVLQ
ncbi:MAG: hypothetical protein P4L82_09265, partial [Ancalomicrobiaceae bacterium]|nr:hypothetical protein [Ancalomicrobiaceae bacterium]